jgi:hypothetical protein
MFTDVAAIHFFYFSFFIADYSSQKVGRLATFFLGICSIKHDRNIF